MPKINFDKIDDVQDYTPLPEGTYICRIAEVEETTTKHGDEMWRLRLAVLTGPHQGRYIFDNMVFSNAALKRVKLICSNLGLDVVGELDLQPSLIKGRTCRVTADIEEYEDKEGNTKMRNVVPFDGYEKADESSGSDARTAEGRTEDAGNSDVPF